MRLTTGSTGAAMSMILAVLASTCFGEGRGGLTTLSGTVRDKATRREVAGACRCQSAPR